MEEGMSIIGRAAADVDTPALLVDLDRLEANIRRYAENVAKAGVQLRPHIKTHKLPEVISLHLERGITKFKCATIAEAEMLVLAETLLVALLLAVPVAIALDPLDPVTAVVVCAAPPCPDSS